MGVAQSAEWPTPAARILVVDDIAANRLAVAAVLEPLGQQIVEARSGEEALKATLQHDFAVVLMDVQMPDMDGFTTVQLLRQRERTRYTPVIFVTAFGDISVSARGFELGAFDFITKPFNADILRGRISALVTMWQRGQMLEVQAEALRAQAVAAEREHVARESAEAASRMKDEFLAIVSHELRTPLNAILGWAELLAAGTLPADRVQHGLETIARNSRMQARLVEDLLDVSRIVAGKLKIAHAPADMASIARRAAETVAPSANAKNVTLEVVIEGGNHDVIGDAARLQQVAWNLLSNAVKFSSNGAQVTMTLSRERDDQLLRVVDRGVGIEPSFLPFVFDRFRQAEHAGTRQHGGLGLGLAIAQRIVEMHGGTIAAYSEGTGHGASFTVRLPSRSDDGVPRAVPGRERTGPATGQFAAVALPTPRLDGLRILFVDDEPDARELVSMVLCDAGAEVRAAASAAEALALLDKERFDILVSDIGMPGEDGYSLMRKVAALPSPPPAIALSAFTSAQDRERALASGFTTHLPKPLDAPALIAFVDRLARR
ncbi:MAG: two-component hybrid sensor and regulator [Myxococcales bacterium]|nr:two-component hybrid sensor and regulator [Myxococcales bacterium]